MKKVGILMLVVSLVANLAAQTGYKTATAGEGVSGIRVGKSTRSDVIKTFGKNFTTVKNGNYSFQMKYKNGISFYFCQRDEVQEIFDIEMRAPFKVKTNKGIVIGKSTVSDVKKKYGKPKQGLRYRGIEFYYATFRGKDVVTVIDIVENRGLRQCD